MFKDGSRLPDDSETMPFKSVTEEEFKQMQAEWSRDQEKTHSGKTKHQDKDKETPKTWKIYTPSVVVLPPSYYRGLDKKYKPHKDKNGDIIPE
ncbi:MAG: hypothetical protein LUE25_01130 [Clostridiales bacterium]|nr:hypothetical protein [Clostridiales bacterium]